MKKIILSFITVIVFLFSALNGLAQQASIIKLAQLDDILNKKNDTTYVINFWATWCKPCVKELPYFIEEENKHKNEKVRFVFISLDFKRDLDTRLNAFIKEHKLNTTIYLIDEPDYDKWIDKVDTAWQGNIPATLIYNFKNNKREFYPKDFEALELSVIIKKML